MVKDEWEEVESSTVNWGKIGDNISGTLINVQHDIETQFGPNSIYTIKGDTGSYTNKTSSEIKVEEGMSYDVWGRGDVFNGKMNGLKIGQKVKLQYAEDKKSQKGNPAKIIKVLTNKKMDEEWLESQADIV